MAPPGEIRGKGGMVYLQCKKLCDPCWALQKWSNSLEALYKWHTFTFLAKPPKTGSECLDLEWQFLRASAMLKHVIAIGWTSVCLSVRPSVTRWHPIKTAEYIVMLSSPHDSPFILVLCLSRSSRNYDGVTPCGAAKQRWGLKMSQFSTNNSLYLRNGWR